MIGWWFCAALCGQAPGAATAAHGMAVSVSEPASAAGRDVLAAGGNAVDAAVAMAFALAVTFPEAGNLAGGGFMLVRPAGADAEPTLIDYRETAPASAARDTFLHDRTGFTHRAVATPGTVRGLALAHRKYGSKPWAELVRPALKLAAEGFPLDGYVALKLNEFLAKAPGFAEAQRVYSRPGGGAWQAGERLVQPDLAWSLGEIAAHGPDAFYLGAIAEKIGAEMRRGGGLLTAADLAGYRALERKPLRLRYRGHDIYAPPPPSSGGVCLALTLGMLEGRNLRQRPADAPENLHLIAEAMRRAYRERARWLGDPEFAKIPAELLDPAFAQRLGAGIDPARATPSAALAGEIKLAGEHDSTTHFSVVDAAGMAVSNTYTLEDSFGSKIVVPGAGFLLNDEMQDFNWRPGVTTRGGRIGTEANAVAPGKRMLSSQTPVLVVKDGKTLLVTGSPGGRTIPNTVACVLLNVLEFGMEPPAAVAAPRLHHQWFPDRLQWEAADREPAAAARLRALGHEVVAVQQGDAHTIWVDPRTGLRHGIPDRRRSGAAAGY